MDPDPTKSAPDISCLSCGTPRPGEFCPACGQQRTRRLGFRRIAEELVESVVDVGRRQGLLFTCRELTLRPGSTVRDYADGRRRPFTNPVKYAFLALTLLALAIGLSGTDPGQSLGLPERSEISQKAADVANALLAYLSFVSLLPVAVIQRWLFRGRMNVAENYAFQLYVNAQVALVYTLLIALGLMQSPAGFALLGIFQLTYTLFALAGFHQVRGVSLVLRGVLLHLAAFVVLNVTVVALANLIYRLGLLDWMAEALG